MANQCWRPVPRARRAMLAVLVLLALTLAACTSSSTGQTSSPASPSPASSPSPSAASPAPSAAPPAWGFPFQPGQIANIGLPENHEDSRLHDANYDTITDDTSHQIFTLGHDSSNTDWQYASLDIGVYGGAISSQDVSDENALALAPGTVLAVEQNCNAVLIDYGGGWWAIYLHLNPNRIWVQSGDRVVTGSPIGVPTVNVSGCEQSSSFQHVHLAFLHNGQYVSMRGMLLCGHPVLDNGIGGVQTVPPDPTDPTKVPVKSNFLFKVPANCPAEQPATNVVNTTTSAGYRVLVGGVTGVEAQWVMPRISGPSGSAMNFSINLGSWQGSQNVHVDGSMILFTFGEIQSDGSIDYYASFDEGGNESKLSLPLAPGDAISASMVLANSTWTITLTNVTQHQTAKQTASGIADETYPTFDIGPSASNSSSDYPLANFTPLKITAARVRIGKGAWTDLGKLPYQQTAMSQNNTLVGKASPIQGGSFGVLRVNPAS